MKCEYDVVKIERKTLETQIKMSVSIDGSGKGFFGTTGVGFFDHMINSFAIHSGLKIEVEMKGDLNVDCHHTIEDFGICLGKALAEISQKCKPNTRYGLSYIPMDEALARSVIDISGRPFLVLNYVPKAPMIGEFDTQMTSEFFRAVAFNMNATLHLEVLYAQNDHHAVEALFKAFAHSFKQAIEPIEGNELSAKGVL